MPKANPIIIRDFSRGIYRKSSVSEVLIPNNSVSHSININYDEIIGKAKVRAGTTSLATVHSTSTPLGLAEFVGSVSSPDTLIAAAHTSAIALYYYDNAWYEAAPTGFTSNTAKVRMATLGSRIFIVNGVNSPVSSADGVNWEQTNCPTTSEITPSLVIRSKARLLMGGDPTYPDRVYFSAVITTPNSLTWDTDETDGDWIDINPDDNCYLTGFAETSNVVLVFKNEGMYRLNVITKSTEAENLFNVGAVSQEAITNCQGIVYFFTGTDIRRTNGGFPEEISRLGVQDWIDAIPQSNWENVAMGNDRKNVFVSIGDITLNTNQDNEKTYNNVVLKFSVRDETWSVHSYADEYRFYTNMTDSADGRKLIGFETDGVVQKIDKGTTDNSTPIYYELETQEQECGNRVHTKKISDNIVALCEYGQDGILQIKENDGDFKDLKMSLNKRVNVGDKINSEGNFFTFRWIGNSSQKAPILEGIYIENITDLGLL